MSGRKHVLRGRTFVHSKPSITHFPFLDRLFDHVAHMENDKKVQENNGQYRIKNEGVIHEGNLMTKPINKKPRCSDTGGRRVFKINEPYIFKSYRKLTLDFIVFIHKSGIFRFYKERNSLIKDIWIL